MADKNTILKAAVTAAAICAVGAGGWAAVKHFTGGAVSNRSEKVYVQKVAAVNTVNGGNLFATNFAGVIVAQKTVDVKYDTTKTIDEILVTEGALVKKGDKLLTYNVEEIQLDIDSKKLEIERLENSIDANKLEIERLEQEKRHATGDAQISYTTQILSLQSANSLAAYDVKAKNAELKRLEQSLQNAYVTAPISGRVKSLKEPGADMYSENADVIMTIAAEGDFRVKGVFNEQNGSNIAQGAPVLLHSRVDDSVSRGRISEIDTSPQESSGYNMYDYGYGNEQNQASKYVFYVEPESLDGFMLGQHLLIETGVAEENEETRKEGVWLYNGFVMWDGDKNYVWAKTSRDRIEKRIVEIGQVDDAAGDCQILSGLQTDDYIAYPADYIEEGMLITTSQSDKDIPDNANFYNDAAQGSFDAGGFGGGQDYIDENVSYDDDSSMVYKDDEGNSYVIDEDGNIVEGGDGLLPEDSGDESSADGSAGAE